MVPSLTQGSRALEYFLLKALLHELVTNATFKDSGTNGAISTEHNLIKI